MTLYVQLLVLPIVKTTVLENTVMPTIALSNNDYY